jgi:type IV secretion system protein VirB2
MFKDNYPGYLLTVFVFICLVLVAGAASAGNISPSGSPLPGTSALQQLRDFITGPYAYTISLSGIVVAGGALLFGGNDMGGFVRTALYVALVGSLIMGAGTFMTTVFSGALIP